MFLFNYSLQRGGRNGKRERESVCVTYRGILKRKEKMGRETAQHVFEILFIIALRAVIIW